MSFHTKIHMSVFKGLLRKEADTFVAGKSAKFKFKFESTYRTTLIFISMYNPAIKDLWKCGFYKHFSFSYCDGFWLYEIVYAKYQLAKTPETDCSRVV